MVIVQLETEIRAQYIISEIPGSARLFDRLLHALVYLPDFAVDIVVAGSNAHCIRTDKHALDQKMRVVAHDIAVFEGSWFTLVRVAYQILFTLILLGHETPL